MGVGEVSEISRFNLGDLVYTPDGVGTLVYVGPDRSHAIEFPFEGPWKRYPAADLMTVEEWAAK